MPAGAVRGSLPSLCPHHSSEQHLPECRSPPVDSRPQGIESGQASLQEELGAAIGAEGSGSRARARKSAVSAEEAFTPLSLRVCVCGSRVEGADGGCGRTRAGPRPPASPSHCHTVLGHRDPAWRRLTETWKSQGPCRDADRAQPKPRLCSSKGSEKRYTL